MTSIVMTAVMMNTAIATTTTTSVFANVTANKITLIMANIAIAIKRLTPSAIVVQNNTLRRTVTAPLTSTR